MAVAGLAADAKGAPAGGGRPGDKATPGAVRQETMLALVFLAAAELALAFVHISFGWRLLPMLVLHAAAIAAAAWWLSRRHAGQGGDATPAILSVLAVAVAGPVGAMLALLFARAATTPATDGALLDDWYKRIALAAEIDPVTELCDNVASGRTMNLAAPPPSPFAAVMSAGPVADKQTALGLIARRFHPDYLPALVIALKSPEPVVRVQAAAVVARIRDQLTARVRRRLAEVEAGGTRDRTAALDELSKAAASGLLDEADRRRAERALGSGDQIGSAPTATPRGHGRAAARRREHDLLDAGRFSEFRVARRERRIHSLGPYRVRPLRLVRAATGSSR